MSGGHFEYQQYVFIDIANEIDRLIEKGDYGPEIIKKFKETSASLVRAHKRSEGSTGLCAMTTVLRNLWKGGKKS